MDRLQCMVDLVSRLIYAEIHVKNAHMRRALDILDGKTYPFNEISSALMELRVAIVCCEKQLEGFEWKAFTAYHMIYDQLKFLELDALVEQKIINDFSSLIKKGGLS